MAIDDKSEEPPSASRGPSDNKDEIESVSSSPDGNSRGGGSESGTDTTFRTQIGSHLSRLTDVVNDNLIIIRYATFSTVFLLGAYGVANTPLFYRYKHLNDIASKVFTKRKSIHGRLIGVLDSANNNAAAYASDVATTSLSIQQTPITILFRHSSPMERLLSKSAMEKILQFTTARGKSTSPSGLLYSSLNTNRNLLPIELAGCVSPPTIASTNYHSSSVLSTTLTKASSTSSSSTSSQVPEVLQSLIETSSSVSLQMLALRTDSSYANNGTERSTPSLLMDENSMQSAICHLNYRKPWFSTTNLGLELVQRGQALVNQDGLVIPTKDDNNAALINFNPTVKQLQADSKFISQLEQAEFAAWKSREGVWSSSQMRELRKEYVEEEEYLKSSLWSKIKRVIGGSSRK